MKHTITNQILTNKLNKMEENFKIGDRIRITKSNKSWSTDGEMNRFVGQTHIISRIINYNGNHYQFEDNSDNINRWYWRYSNQHFVKIEEPVKTFEPLPHYQINEITPNGNILSGINNEGSIFEIDDNVVSLGLTASVVRKITGFRYNNAKTEICAIFRGLPYGISINKLQHYIKPKVIEPIKEETNLEKAIRLFPAGTKVRSTVNTIGVSSGVVRNHESDGSDIFIKREDTTLGSLCVYDAGQDRWATIIND